MKKKTKILIIISTLTGGGAERAVSSITTNLPANVEADLLLNSISEKDYPTNANIITLNMKPRIKKNIIYHLFAFIKRIHLIKELKKKNKYDGCYSFLESANFANILTGKKYCKTIVSVRNNLSQDPDTKYKYLINPIAKILYKKADFVIALSNGVRADLIRNFHLKETTVKIIYNGYDVNLIKEKSKCVIDSDIQTFIDKSSFCFVSTGRHVNQKGHWHLIRSFTEVLKHHPNARLILLGQGPLTNYIQSLITNYGISDNVKLLGFIDNPFRVMSKCDAFVFPSLFEGFGNVAVEALSCQLPVISTDFRSGAREILAPFTSLENMIDKEIEITDYGILTPVFSGKQYVCTDPLESAELYMVEAMNLIMEDEFLYEKLKINSTKRANEFSIHETVENWLSLLENKE